MEPSTRRNVVLPTSEKRNAPVRTLFALALIFVASSAMAQQADKAPPPPPPPPAELKPDAPKEAPAATPDLDRFMKARAEKRRALHSTRPTATPPAQPAAIVAPDPAVKQP